MASNGFSDAFDAISASLGGGEDVLLLPLDLIDEDPDNPRTHFEDDELTALAETIRRKGLLQPITVKAQGADGRYRLRFGARRLRAARLAGLAEVRALVQVDEPDAAEAIIEQLIENDQREGLSTADLARSVARLLDLGLKQAEVGRRLGRPKEQVAMLAAVRDMPPELQALASQLGARTLYELHGAWKTDAGRTKVWLAGREPRSITQASARELAGRPAPNRQVVRNPSDGPTTAAPARGAARPAAGTHPSRAAEDGPNIAASGTAVFEVEVDGVRGELVLDNVRTSSLRVVVRLKDGSVRPMPAAQVRIVRVRPG